MEIKTTFDELIGRLDIIKGIISKLENIFIEKFKNLKNWKNSKIERLKTIRKEYQSFMGNLKQCNIKEMEVQKD